MEDIKVLAFDTGGTVLDWHAGLTAAFAAWGAAQGIERDWHCAGERASPPLAAPDDQHGRPRLQHRRGASRRAGRIVRRERARRFCGGTTGDRRGGLALVAGGGFEAVNGRRLGE